MSSTYSPLGKYKPRILLTNLATTVSTTQPKRYVSTLTYLYALEDRVAAVATRIPPPTTPETTTHAVTSAHCTALIRDASGDVDVAHAHIGRTLGRYSNSTLATPLEVAAALVIQLCNMDSLAFRRTLHDDIQFILVQAQDRVKAFHEGENAWMVDGDIADLEMALRPAETGSILEMRKHVRSMEVAVEGLVVWAGMMKDVNG